MNATAEDLPGADMNHMDETVVHEPKDQSGSGPEDPTGSSEMPKANQSLQQAQGRYTYGSGARPLDGYTIKRAIGRGGFGEVYYATSDSGKEVALKLILRNLDVERRGVSHCMNLKCPNLLTIFDLKTSDDEDTFVVMEYVAGPSLASVLKQYPNGLPPAEIRHWLKGLVEGVAYLHDHGVVHRDLKPANLFMEEGIVKIGDYGLAKLITPSQGTEHSESIGTCHYMAPEIGSGKYHKPIDVYAIGVILYEMLTGKVPFDGETVNEVLMKHLTARPDLSKLAEPYKGIVAKALAKDPNHRPSRLYDLLTPEDAPRAPDVRIIGDAKAGRGAPGGGNAAGAEDDVLRIEAEEPIFYIGPDTRPPRMPGQWRNAVGARLRANWQALKRPARYQPPPPRVERVAHARPNGAPAGQVRRPAPAPAPPPRRVAAAAPAPPPPPALPALPSGRLNALGCTAIGPAGCACHRNPGNQCRGEPAASGLPLRYVTSGNVDHARPQQTAGNAQGGHDHAAARRAGCGTRSGRDFDRTRPGIAAWLRRIALDVRSPQESRVRLFRWTLRADIGMVVAGAARSRLPFPILADPDDGTYVDHAHSSVALRSS
jgi:eukaryotic-like serine/threonine-protein kinase